MIRWISSSELVDKTKLPDLKLHNKTDKTADNSA